MRQRAAPLLKELRDYRLVREIGRGGMGVVYEAEHDAAARGRGGRAREDETDPR